MVFVQVPASFKPLGETQLTVEFNNKTGNLLEIVEPFTQIILRSGRSVIRLNCAVPTWCPSGDNYFDLHDLHELRSRFLSFIHLLIQSLRASGVSASYCLVPSNSPVCLVCALPPEANAASIKSSVVGVLEKIQLTKSENVLLADLEHGACLAMT